MISTVSFYILATLLVSSALMVVTLRNIFTCAMFLASALSLVAGLFVLCGADFLAAVQILLYVGGILIIIAFAVMLSSVAESKTRPQVNAQWPLAFLVSLSIFLILLVILKRTAFENYAGLPKELTPTTGSMGKLLLRDMVLPFEAVSLVLFAALAGAVLFSKREKKEKA